TVELRLSRRFFSPTFWRTRLRGANVFRQNREACLLCGGPSFFLASVGGKDVTSSTTGTRPLTSTSESLSLPPVPVAERNLQTRRTSDERRGLPDHVSRRERPGRGRVRAG